MTDIPLPASQVGPGLNSRRLALGWLARLSRPLRHALRPRRANPDELAAIARAREAAAAQRNLEKRLDELAKEYKRLIINALTRVGVSHVTHEEGKRRVGQVQFYKPAIVTSEAIYYQVNTRRLPWHVTISDLVNEDNINTLMASTGRVIQVVWDKLAPERGCWIVVELKAGVRGIPRHVNFKDILNAIPKTAGPLAFGMGYGVAATPVFEDLSETPHMLIAGATGQGKSVWIEQALLTLLLRNSPRHFKLGIVDLKGGVELGQFKNVPHLIRPVIKDEEEVIDLLHYAKKEIKRRLAMFEPKGIVDIRRWNQFTRARLPRLLIVIDELAALMLTELKSEAEPLLAFIAAQGRSPGVHIWVATQRPEARVITGLIKANFTTKVAFSCADQRSSMVIVDTGIAAGIGPIGRMIYMKGSRKVELQGPFISPTMLQETVAQIIGGQSTEALEKRKRHNMSPDDFFLHAIHNYEGRFPLRPIYEDLKGQGVTLEELKQLADHYEGQEIEIAGDIYKLTGPTLEGFKGSRQLVKIASATDYDADGDSGDDAEPLQEPSLDAFQAIAIPAEMPMQTMQDAGEEDEDGSGSDSE